MPLHTIPESELRDHCRRAIEALNYGYDAWLMNSCQQNSERTTLTPQKRREIGSSTKSSRKNYSGESLMSLVDSPVLLMLHFWMISLR